MRLPAGLLTILLLSLATPVSGHAQQPAAIPVGTVAAALRPVTQANEFVGRVDAMERVDIRARVTGFLQKILFKEGDVVKQGQPLYEIEPDTYKTAEMQARGALLQAQARFANATAQRARTEELVKSNTAAQATLDERVAAERSAQGDIVASDANLKAAQINLGYTEIDAPISGEVALSKYSIGNLVGPDSGVLTTIVSRDPMYITFPVSQREFLQVQKDQIKDTQHGGLAIKIRFSDGSLYDQTGYINFINVMVDRTTDTVLVRATMPNPNGRLIDGQLVRVSVESDKPQDKVLIPQTALLVDQQGTYVFVVQDAKAAIARVKLGAEQGPYVVVDGGLKGGEQVVVQGMETLRNQAPVTASPVPPPPSGT